MINKTKEKREILKLRIVDVALKAGVGVSTVWLIENGYASRTSEKTKEKVASALQCSVQEIFPES